MKKIFLLIFFLISLSAFSQNIIELKSSSIFVNFNQLGISKEMFIKEFGNPIDKDMRYDKERNINEVLYYIEKDKKENLLIISEFIFKNDELIEQKCNFKFAGLDDFLKKISDDLTYIRRWN